MKKLTEADTYRAASGDLVVQHWTSRLMLHPLQDWNGDMSLELGGMELRHTSKMSNASGC